MTAVLMLARPRATRWASIVAAALALTVGALAACYSTPKTAIVLTAWACLALAAAVVDARTGRLPDSLVVSGLVVAAVASAFGSDAGQATAGAMWFGLPMLVVHLMRPDGLGFGDVKLAATLGAGIGLVAPPLVVPAFLLAAISHAGLGAFVRAGNRPMPFGPALALSSVLVVIVGVWRIP
jgi:leader peptidase (prepilin peptidase)/N-methyltransferase